MPLAVEILVSIYSRPERIRIITLSNLNLAISGNTNLMLFVVTLLETKFI